MPQSDSFCVCICLSVCLFVTTKSATNLVYMGVIGFFAMFSRFLSCVFCWIYFVQKFWNHLLTSTLLPNELHAVACSMYAFCKMQLCPTEVSRPMQEVKNTRYIVCLVRVQSVDFHHWPMLTHCNKVTCYNTVTMHIAVKCSCMYPKESRPSTYSNLLTLVHDRNVWTGLGIQQTMNPLLNFYGGILYKLL